jgi:hypothetical protein
LKGHKGLKAFLVILLILALGGTAFVFGWVNIFVKPGEVAVLSSKTHGVSDELVEAGNFRWVWYALIPTNTTILRFHPDTFQMPFSFSGTMASGQAYAQFSGLDAASFDYRFSGRISFRIRIESLPALVRDNFMRSSEDLAAYMDKLAQDIVSGARLLLDEQTRQSGGLEALLAADLGGRLGAALQARFPLVQDLDLLLENVLLPDFDLYRQASSIYLSYLDYQELYLDASLHANAETAINTQLRIDELARYGELLDKYPGLLEYLKIE